MHVIRLTSIVCYEIIAEDNLLATEVCPKGRKYIGGGEAPVYEKYQIHSPNGAVEIMEIIINFFHPFGAKPVLDSDRGFVLLFYSGGFTPCYMLTALRA